jgi:hypothetical protein
MFEQTWQFREKFFASNPEWFRPGSLGAQEMTFAKVIGTDEKPGILYRITNIPDAKKRFAAEVLALKKNNLPSMPGFEQLCSQSLKDAIANQLEYQDLDF